MIICLPKLQLMTNAAPQNWYLYSSWIFRNKYDYWTIKLEFHSNELYILVMTLPYKKLLELYPYAVTLF